MEKYRFLVLPRSSAAHHIPQLLTKLQADQEKRLNGALVGEAREREESTGGNVECMRDSSTKAPSTPGREHVDQITQIAEEAEKALSGKIQEALKTVKRVEYVDQLCMQKGRAYFPWTASSSYVRRVLKQRTSDPTSVRRGSSSILSRPLSSR